ncbi:MAG: methylenetetrahydrofolate reductase [Desulfovibrionaceae bacterium]|nr:methylenetetrahydrofolate reductase [Desulfovibrionaceae bacterium]MBF0514001.1 methylenetetrahydrofolate reductase [Desulfovibrionaceae bacterium]
MRIIDLIAARSEPFLSLEFFPPKQESSWPDFFAVAERLRAIDPLFVSVTYGAGGSTQKNTLDIVTRLRSGCGFTPMAHLTCVGADATAIDAFLASLETAGVDNVLALRGDPPAGQDAFVPENASFAHASDLVRFVRERHPRLGVGVAAYPEKHPQSPSPEDDLNHLKFKLGQGGDFAITQLFFDNALYFAFVAKARAAGIDVPIVPGILPVASLAGLRRILGFCGASVPAAYLAALEEADKQGPEAVRALGVAHATAQARDLLANGAPGVHLYTLNKASSCLEIVKGL